MTNAIPGYDFGTPAAARSPLTLAELRDLEAAAGLTPDDDRYLRMAGDVLAPHAADLVDAWRAALGEHPHLAAYGAHPDGTPNPEYASASHPRFARWVVDACTRPRDQAWLDYQQEIGLRHTTAKKNATDEAESLPYVPLRYVLAFAGPIVASVRPLLASSGHPPADVDGMHVAWTKSVLLHVTLWSRAYTAHPEQW